MAVTTADPSKAYLWLTGDAFRAPAGTKLPEGDLLAKELKGWDAYGGIEAGFEPSVEQSVTQKDVFNYRQAPYKVARDPLKEGMKFRAVDNTKAAMETRLQGGYVVKVGEHYGTVKGVGEEFAFFMRVEDGSDAAFVYCPRATLKGPATRPTIDGQTIDGYEFDLAFLEPAMDIIPELPEGMEVKEEQPASEGGSSAVTPGSGPSASETA